MPGQHSKPFYTPDPHQSQEQDQMHPSYYRRHRHHSKRREAEAMEVVAAKDTPLIVQQVSPPRFIPVVPLQVTPMVVEQVVPATVPTTVPVVVAAQTQATALVSDDFETLKDQMSNFPNTYDTLRKEMDAHSLLGYLSIFRFGVKPKTDNPERIQAANLIHTMAELINSKRTIIEAQDPTILVNALCGVLLPQLQKIDQSYDNAYFFTRMFRSPKCSALATIILRIFKVDSFKDIQPAQNRAALEALDKCFTILETANELDSTPPITALRDEIRKELEPVRPVESEAAPTNATPAMS
ncbi:MAG: hypothetical protein A3F46_01885 [Legionellales bacterium RIFCSPHIGHO2_12_FULL_42_9]|nr:MAG: hypothetical protein A3F46_01885 [Legionellales bacterium RIFCSPHIGHO2_12_FULL_42_9]